MQLKILLLTGSLFFIGCEQNTNGDKLKGSLDLNVNGGAGSAATLFERLDPSTTGLDFENRLLENDHFNYFTYQYFYNGAGVGAGDVDNDGRVDLYFAGNQTDDRLYLNQGDFKFKNVTNVALKGNRKGWSTGVSMVDINADGWLDIYVCRAGPVQDAMTRTNLLYINNRDGTFEEKAAEYGLDEAGYSTQAYFFDYDKDGDLDCYVVNHRTDFENNTKISSEIMNEYIREFSDQLYRNEGDGRFVNVSREAGIANRAWGLSAAICDFDGDGWTDIYVANDFLEPDYLYINKGDGSFREAAKQHFNHISFYGMGSDVGDINNDGLMDLIVLDMVSEEHARSKRNMASMSNANFWAMVSVGYHYQYMLNTLQLNRGKGHYSEIAQMAGVQQTDWSWGPLFADFDLDGLQDLFVTNGIKRDVTDNDFKLQMDRIRASNERISPTEALDLMPAQKVHNYIFKNRGELKFDKMLKEWGLTDEVHSNGAAYADLDGDGDLDLVTNNIDATAGIYRNNAEDWEGNWITVSLNGPQHNPRGIGARIELDMDGKKQYRELYCNRGFMSSMTGPEIFGLGDGPGNIKMKVRWPDGKMSYVDNISSGDRIEVNYIGAQAAEAEVLTVNPGWFTEIDPGSIGLDFVHVENEYDDFVKEILLPHRQSRHGPPMAGGDVNGDGLEDLFIGGAVGQSGVLYVQNTDGSFDRAASNPWHADIASEDLAAHFFDADNDGDADLYVASGGNEYEKGSTAYRDRLYLNDGNGNFRKSEKALPDMRSSSSTVAAADFDGDGDLDLFVGGRGVPASYPFESRSWLLRNEGGNFVDATPDILKKPGMVTDVSTVDHDGDGDADLQIVGEWMGIHFYKNENGKFSRDEDLQDLAGITGWWFSIEAVDVDGDGDADFIAGNIGENNKFQPDEDKPLHIYTADFDEDGRLDIVLSKESKGALVPVRGRECSSEQMPFIKDKFPTFKSFAEARLPEIYSEEKLDAAHHLQAVEFAHLFLLNEGGTYKTIKLPAEAQLAPLMGVRHVDVDGDAAKEVIGLGNFYMAEVETVRYDAGFGFVLEWEEDKLKSLPPVETGLYAGGDVKDMAMVQLADGSQLIVLTRNNGPLKVFRMKAPSERYEM